MIWLVLVAALALRLISLNQSLWLDEGINILAAKNFSFLGMITQYAQADFHPPGWFIILWVWTKLFGYSEIATRIPSVIFGVITIYVIYLIGKKMVSKNLGLITAILLSVNPLHIYYSQEARMYSLAALAVSVNILFLLKLVKGEKLNILFLSLSNLAIFASDYLAYFIFPAEGFFLLLTYKKEIIKKWLMAFAIAALLGIWWLPIFFQQLNTGSIASANLPTWKFVTGTFDFKTLPLTFVKFIIGRISLADKTIYAAILLPVCSLFGLLLLRGVKQTDSVTRKLLVSWLVIPVFIAAAVSAAIPVYNYFRVLFIMPGFLILISQGIMSFDKRLRYIVFGLVLLIEVFSALVYLLNPAYQREDWKGVVNYLKSKDQNSIVLFESSGILPPFDYYSQGSVNAKGALADFPAKDSTAVVNLDNLVGDYNQVYLVDYLVQITDPNRLAAKKLLDLGYKETEVKDFTGVGFIYHYVKL